MNTQDFVKYVNKTRLENKNKWYFLNLVVNDKQVMIKGFGTWLQVFNVNGLNIPTVSDISVTDFKKLLSESV